MIKVAFKGGKELEAALKSLDISTARKRGVANRALDQAAVPIRDEWQRGVDVDQGDLRRSIKIGSRAATKATRRIRRSTGGAVVERFVGIDAREDARLAAIKGSPGYAYIEEFGNAGQPANPAGRRAFETKKQAAVDLIANTLRAEITKAAKK